MATDVAHAGHGARTEAEALHRVRINRLGLWLFFFSDGLLFLLFAASRFYLSGTERTVHLNQLLGLGVTSLLLLSSLTAYRAETAFVHGDHKKGRPMLLLTIVMGLLFVAGVSTEWSIAEFEPSSSFGTAFFSMTGMHALHVVTGVLFLFIVWARSGSGRFSGGAAAWPITAVVMYWHFVDVVWVFFYPTLYLVK